MISITASSYVKARDYTIVHETLCILYYYICVSGKIVFLANMLSSLCFAVGSEFLRNHVDFGETFGGEWKLFETCRATYNFWHKKMGAFSGPTGLIAVMGASCDFLHPRLNRSTALQCIHHVSNSISVTLYDGVTQEDMELLLMEAAKLCVTSLQ